MSNSSKLPAYCQLHTIPKLSVGLVDLGPIPFRKRMKFWLKRNLNAKTKRLLKNYINALPSGLFTSKSLHDPIIPTNSDSSLDVLENPKPVVNRGLDFNVGDLVKIRSQEEIRATLDGWNELRGCMFMPDMWQYCDTTQMVFKIIERFVDERDYRLKKGRGILLLDGLICQGTEDYGRCDRSCFYFWRVEWLEKIEE